MYVFIYLLVLIIIKMATTPTTVAQSGSWFAGLSTFAERQQEKFPLNTFFSLQTFRLYHGTVDLVGNLIELPLSLLQL